MGNGKGVIGANRFTPFYFFTLLSAYVTPAMSEVLGSLFRMYGFEHHLIRWMFCSQNVSS